MLTGEQDTILVAEDEQSILDLIRQTLVELQFSVVTARNGEEAVRTFQLARHRVRLFLSDFKMPKMNGLDAAVHIHSLCPKLPIVIMSGDVVRIPNAANWRFLAKPFSTTALLSTISASLSSADDTPKTEEHIQSGKL